MATEKEFDNCLTVTEHISSVEQGPIETGDEITIAEERKIIRKIDRRLVTAVAIMFSVSLIDRTNLAGANIAGLSKELHLDTGYRYSLAILVFFIPHVLLQWPGVLLVTKFGPRLVLPTMVVLWGCITLCFGFMKNWEQMIALRVLVGIFEAGLLPGCILLLQVWYRRYDVHKRFALFYAGSICGSSFSGILAYGFMHMGGVGGLSGWRYIFIWEGVLTILIGFMSAFLIVDFPQNAQRSWRFLDPREHRHIVSMLEADRKDVTSEPFRKSHLVSAVLDVKIWAFSVIYFASTVMAYAIAYFVPIILNQKMGYSVAASQLLSTPPFFFAGAFMYAQGWIGDKYRLRAPIVVWNAIQGICGLSLLTWPNAAGVQYLGLFLLASAANASIPCAMAYQANNICGQGKRTVASACMVVLGGIGGIVGALVFRSQDAPRYLPGIYAGLGCCGIQLVVTGFLTMYLRAQNRRAAKGDLVLEGIPGFRYTL